MLHVLASPLKQQHSVHSHFCLPEVIIKTCGYLVFCNVGVTLYKSVPQSR